MSHTYIAEADGSRIDVRRYRVNDRIGGDDMTEEIEIEVVDIVEGHIEASVRISIEAAREVLVGLVHTLIPEVPG